MYHIYYTYHITYIYIYIYNMYCIWLILYVQNLLHIYNYIYIYTYISGYNLYYLVSVNQSFPMVIGERQCVPKIYCVVLCILIFENLSSNISTFYKRCVVTIRRTSNKVSKGLLLLLKDLVVIVPIRLPGMQK